MTPIHTYHAVLAEQGYTQYLKVSEMGRQQDYVIFLFYTLVKIFPVVKLYKPGQALFGSPPGNSHGKEPDNHMVKMSARNSSDLIWCPLRKTG